MIKKLITLIILISFSMSASAQNFYIIKKGDTLSQIVMNYTSPPPPLYGENGRLERIIALNPQINNSNLIIIGDKIILKVVSNNPLEAQAPIPSKENTAIIKSPPKAYIADRWNIGTSYGSHYLSYTQTGDLGSSEIAQTIPNHLNIYSQYEFDNFSFTADFKTYNFSFESSSSEESQRINSFNLEGAYNFLILGIALNDSPLFKNNAGAIELSKLSITTIRVGAQKQWKLPVKKKTKLKLKALIDYPLSSSSNSSDIETSSISGFSFFTNLKLSREILKKKNYSINAIWPIYFNYQNLTTKLTWGATNGSSKSTIRSAGTRLGLEVEF